jgi:hypothetical protein
MTAPPDLQARMKSWAHAWMQAATGESFEWYVAKAAHEAGAAAEREAVITKLCTEHVHEDDLIEWLRARANKGDDRGK